GEPEPGADPHTLGREAGIEDPREVRGRDPAAGILDVDADVAAVLDDAHADRAALGDGLDGVHQQVHEHLVQLPGVTGDHRHCGVLTDDLDPAAVQVL